MTETSPEQNAYDSAMTKVRNGGKGLTYNEGGTSAEIRMVEAYAAMVRTGEAPPLRGKYRSGRRFKKVRS